MRYVVVPAALLTILSASASYTASGSDTTSTAPPDATWLGEEGGVGGSGLKLASALGSSFLVLKDAHQSHLVAVAEGGEGGEGSRGKRSRKHRRDRDRDGYLYERRRGYTQPDVYRQYQRPYGRPSSGRLYFD